MPRDFGRKPVAELEILPRQHGIELVVRRAERAGGVGLDHARRVDHTARELEDLLLVGEIELRGLEVDLVREGERQKTEAVRKASQQRRAEIQSIVPGALPARPGS